MTDKATAFTENYEWTDSLYHMTWPAVVTIYGIPKSGKTYLLFKILKNIKQHFDRIIVYTGSKDQIPQFENLISKNKPQITILTNYNESDLLKYYDKLENEQVKLIKQKKTPKSVLMVADDILTFGNMMKTSRNSPSALEKIAANYRHINLSLIITSQRYMQVIPALRHLNFKYMFVCEIGKKDMEKVANEHESLYFNANHIEDAYKQVRKNGIGHVFMIDGDAKNSKEKLAYIQPNDTKNIIITKIIL
jgi:hypothetical protein